MKRNLHINLNLNTTGYHRAAWRAPDGRRHGFIDIGHYLDSARLAEKGMFDAVFLADYVAIGEHISTDDSLALDPFVVASAILTHTTHVGAIVTASTTYSHPYQLARSISSLDHISGGRVGLNAVTSRNPAAAGNFGLEAHPASEDRWERANEFIDIVIKLWDSWEEGALPAERETGLFADLSRIHAIDHRGKHFNVTGPLQLPRSPQGRPLIVQAGPSEGGRAFASKYANAIFTGQHTLEAAQVFARDIRGRTRTLGRPDNAVAILPGLHITLGGTEKEAWQRLHELEELVAPEARIRTVALALGLNPSDLDIDKPVPLDLLEGRQEIASPLGHGVLELVRTKRLTVRELSAGGYTAHQRIVGTPEQVADHMVKWFRFGAVDGFNISADVYPTGLEAFVDQVVPLLQRQGVFRSHYEENMLRDRYAKAPRAVEEFAPAKAS